MRVLLVQLMKHYLLMVHIVRFFSLLFVLSLASCTDESGDTDNKNDKNLYFPTDLDWETLDPMDIGWETDLLPDLFESLSDNGTRAFIVLKDGKIVIEEYFGKTILGTADFDKDRIWYWASAGKTLTATIVGIAQQQGLLDINNSTSDYLGTGWTSMSAEREQNIKIRHQLTMATGLDESVDDPFDFSSSSLQYLTDPGSRWYYHNAPYTLLDQVVENAVGQTFEDYFDQVIGEPIGMSGEWKWTGNNHVYYSTARDMARFGLLMLNEGKWKDQILLTDNNYYQDMITPSQSLNPSYGYLWWLNGQSSLILPQSDVSLSEELAPSAPADMYCGLGANGQYLCVIPSENIVMVRMGENPENSLVPLLYLRDIWSQLNSIIP